VRATKAANDAEMAVETKERVAGDDVRTAKAANDGVAKTNKVPNGNVAAAGIAERTAGIRGKIRRDVVKEGIEASIAAKGTSRRAQAMDARRAERPIRPRKRKRAA
jgi:hypothetical protein